MGEEKRKEPVSVDELLFGPIEGGCFFNDNPRDKKYCLLLNYTETPEDADRMYGGFCSGSFVRTGEAEPMRIDISEQNISGLKRLITSHAEQKKFLFINAPKGINIMEILNEIYALDMNRYKLVYRKKTISHKFSEQARSRLGSLSQ